MHLSLTLEAERQLLIDPSAHGKQVQSSLEKEITEVQKPWQNTIKSMTTRGMVRLTHRSLSSIALANLESSFSILD